MPIAEELAIARMKADLGVARREAISTVRVDHKGQRIQGDERVQNAAVDRARQQHDEKVAKLGGEDGVKVKKWNALGQDASDAGVYIDRWGGQGHRAGMAAPRAEDDSFNRDADQFGEERALHNLQRGVRRMPGQSRAQRASRAVIAPTDRPRAASPGASGSAIFVKGKLVSSTGRPVLRSSQLPAASTAAIRKQLSDVNLLKQRSSAKVPKQTAHDSASVSSGRSRIKHDRVRTRAEARQDQAEEDVPITTSWQKFAKIESSPMLRVAQGTKAAMPAAPVPAASVNATTASPPPAATAQTSPETDHSIPPRKDYLRLKDIKLAAPGIKLSEVYSVLDNLFNPGRRDWLLAHPHLVPSAAKLGYMLREEMMVAASLGESSMCWKSFMEEFGFMHGILDHLSAAVRALQYAKHKHPVDQSFFDQHDQYQAFRNMAQEMQRPRKETIQPSPDLSNANTHSGKDSHKPQNYVLTVEAPEAEAIRDQEPRSMAHETRGTGILTPDLIALMKKTARAMMSRAETWPDGVYKKNGIFYINPN